MPRKISRKGLINKLDKLAGEVVRARDQNQCQWCKKIVTGSNCHVSHVIPKSKGYALRWDLQNLKVLCFHCHINVWHKSPAEGWTWFQKEMPKRAEYLMKHKNDIIPSYEREKFMLDKLKELKNVNI